MATRHPKGDNQQRILEYIQSEIQKKGYPPSVREIAAAVGLKSTSTVHGHLERLEKRGLIKRDKMKPRAMEVVNDRELIQHTSTPVPVVGHVQAGLPILAEQNLEDYVALPEVMLGKGQHFILRVHGESMIGAGIFDGDYIVVNQQSTARNGDIIVAMIDDSVTVKRFFRENDGYRLQPENPDMSPIHVKNLTIVGEVVSLFRLIK